MNSNLRHNKDFLAGLLFVAIGVPALLIARGYPMGTAMRMGSGYFPTVLAGILLLFGAVLMLRGIVTGSTIDGAWRWKPVALLTLSMLLFGFFVTRLGLLPALVAMFFVAALAGREFRFGEVLLLSAAMCAFAAGVFVYGLKLPFRLLAGL